MSKGDSMQEEEDEEVRNDIEIISTRLYDLKERFMNITQKIKDSNGFVNPLSEEEDTTDEESCEETSDNEDEEEEKENGVENENEDEKKTEKFLIKCILASKARRYEYLKNIIKYPKIMKFLLNDNPNFTQIPIRYLEPFIKEYVDENPNGKIYDKISQQIHDIRSSYLRNRE